MRSLCDEFYEILEELEIYVEKEKLEALAIRLKDTANEWFNR